MTTREVIFAGEVIEVSKGRFWVSYTLKLDEGGRTGGTELGLFPKRRLRPGQRIEYVRVRHSLLGGKIRWTDESTKIVKRTSGAAGG